MAQSRWKSGSVLIDVGGGLPGPRIPLRRAGPLYQTGGKIPKSSRRRAPDVQPLPMSDVAPIRSADMPKLPWASIMEPLREGLSELSRAWELPDPWQSWWDLPNKQWQKWNNYSAGYVLGPGWSKCATPTCVNVVKAFRWGNNIGFCGVFGPCPFDGAGASWVPINTNDPVRTQLLVGDTGPGVANFVIGQFLRQNASLTNWPTYRAERRATAAPAPVPLPKPHTEPMADPRPFNASPNPRPRVSPDARVVAKPSALPAVNYAFNPAGRPLRTVGEHHSRPGDRARKRKGSKAMAAAIGMMHSLSEIGDMADALYNALPPIARCPGKRGLVHDLACVLEHADAYSDPAVFAAAVRNLVANEVEDKVIGTLMGSNWRTGVRPDNYGGAAWVGGGYGAPGYVDPGAGGLFSVPPDARMSNL